MNYSLNVNDVSLASFLIALGFAMRDYKIVNSLDLNTSAKRGKSATWRFDDTSMFFNKLGSCEDVIKLYKLPEKYKPCTNLAQYAKLCNHNYQVLKSVITENKPLKQIVTPYYTMLKNDSGEGEHIPTGFNVGTKSLAAVAIAATLGCEINSYNFDGQQLIIHVETNKEGLNAAVIEHLLEEYAVGNDDEYDPLHVLIAMMLNRKELMSGVYNTEKVAIHRGDGLIYFDKNANAELKQKLLDGLNSL